MKIDGIIRMREYKGKVFSDIVYEWEDDLSQLLRVPIINWGKRHEFVSHVIHFSNKLDWIKSVLFGSRKHYLRFVMNALDDTPLFNHKSCIPVIIDFFVSDKRIKNFVKIYDKCEYVFISSKQAFDKLSEYQMPFQIVHFPLTLSDRYITDAKDTVKKYSLTLLGAQIVDETLKGYIDKYCTKHPDFSYVYKEKDGNRYFTNKGEFVIDAQSRSDYFKLLKETKVVVYSTPGIRGRKDANGYDQVTPKFLEMLACGCHVIPRYTINSDTEYFELPKFSKSVDTYDEFEVSLTKYLSMSPINHNSYLPKHSTSSLCEIIERI